MAEDASASMTASASKPQKLRRPRLYRISGQGTTAPRHSASGQLCASTDSKTSSTGSLVGAAMRGSSMREHPDVLLSVIAQHKLQRAHGKAHADQDAIEEELESHIGLAQSVERSL